MVLCVSTGHSQVQLTVASTHPILEEKCEKELKRSWKGAGKERAAGYSPALLFTMCSLQVECQPFHLEAAGCWSKLKNCLVDIDMFGIWWTPVHKKEFVALWASLTNASNQVTRSRRVSGIIRPTTIVGTSHMFTVVCCVVVFRRTIYWCSFMLNDER